MLVEVTGIEPVAGLSKGTAPRTCYPRTGRIPVLTETKGDQGIRLALSPSPPRNEGGRIGRSVVLEGLLCGVVRAGLVL